MDVAHTQYVLCWSDFYLYAYSMHVRRADVPVMHMTGGGAGTMATTAPHADSDMSKLATWASGKPVLPGCMELLFSRLLPCFSQARSNLCGCAGGGRGRRGGGRGGAACGL